MRLLLPVISLLFSIACAGQPYKVSGKIVNSKQEPLAFASVQVKGYNQGAVTKEDGSFEMELEEGKYELVFSMVGYKVQVITIIVIKKDYYKDIIMEAADAGNLSEVIIKGKTRDKAEEYIRNVIRGKDAIEAAA
ncbi:MAG: carboxypeptidase-like regulatory domain-containing protein, partial [Chitinophagaceae bacterium]|nr:carboxypeptidase-like regulatory domain-containing protein [Chitinophagaceae bacterium]